MTGLQQTKGFVSTEPYKEIMTSKDRKERRGRISYSMGHKTLQIPSELFITNRARLCKRLREEYGMRAGTVILLRGGDRFMRHDTDVEVSRFRQESNFYWLFGVSEPGCFATLDVHKETTALFVPRPSPYEEELYGLPDLEKYSDKYDLDATYYVEEVGTVLRERKIKKILTLKPRTTCLSGYPVQEATFPGIKYYQVCNNTLDEAFTECRVIKTDLEIDVLRYVNHISSEAQLEVMKRACPGWYEHQAESFFVNYCYMNGGLKGSGWENIVRSGPNNAFQRYTHTTYHENRQMKDGDLLMLDFSMEYSCYAADITFTYPVNGKFTPEQRDIYNAVLKTRNTVLAATKPGNSSLDCQLLAERTMLGELKKLGILRGDIDAMINERVAFVFMPHGIGHLIGVDVIDAGGITKEHPRDSTITHISLYRPLEVNMVKTIEPGCYFNNWLINKALSSPSTSQFIVKDVLEQYRHTGGVRIEDTCVITPDGAELLSLPDLPRTVEEIEAFMAKHRIASS